MFDSTFTPLVSLLSTISSFAKQLGPFIADKMNRRGATGGSAKLRRNQTMRFSLPSGALQVAAKGLESQGQQTGTGDGPFPHQGHRTDPYIE